MLECNDGSDPILEHIELTEEQRLSVLYRLHALKGKDVISEYHILTVSLSSYESFDRILKQYEGV
jgi:hypothetical protein